MKRILIILLGLFSVAYGQFSPTSAKTAMKWGVALGSRDSTAYAANDSLVVVINRQGRMMYRSTDGYWKILSNAGASDYKQVSDTFFTTGYTTRARLKQYGDSLGAVKPSGSGISGQVTYWNGTNSVTGSSKFTWNNSLAYLGIDNSAAPLAPIHVGNRNVNNSTDAVILISRNVDSLGYVGNGHAFSDASRITRNGYISYNSYDARIDILGTQQMGHYAAFQAAPVYNNTNTMDQYYALYTAMDTRAGTITSSYGHYAANPIGSGTITNNYGLFVEAQTKGQSNYGVWLNTASGTNNWNLYVNGTAPNFIRGYLGLGSGFSVNNNFRISRNISGAASAYSVRQDGIVQTDVTSIGGGFLNQSNLAASTAITDYRHYYASQGTFGAGASASVQTGFHVDNSFTAATSNYGFRGQLNSAANTFNLFMDGSANNHLAGSLGIGTTSMATSSFVLGKTITGGTTSYATLSQGQIQSSVTANAYYNRTFANTQAASFTLNNLYHYSSGQSTFGAGSAVTNQYGFNVESNMINGALNIAFNSEIPQGTNNWGLYMNGTAPNFLRGYLGIGAGFTANNNLRVSRIIGGAATAYSIRQDGVVRSDVTTAAGGYLNQLNTLDSTFTLSTYNHFYAAQGTKGASNTLTNQVGFLVDNSFTAATNNYAFRGQISSGTNRWNTFMDGTAPNYFAGKVFVGTTTDVSGADLLVGGAANVAGALTSGQFRLSALNTAPSSATDTGTLGEIRITTDYIYVCVATNTWVRSALTTW